MYADQFGKAKTALVVVLLVVAAVGATFATTWYFLHPRGAAGNVAYASETPAPVAPPVFYELQPFTVNLHGSSENDILYVAITLQLGNKQTREFLAAHAPQVRNRILMDLSALDAATIGTDQGKRDLAAHLKQALEATDGFAANQPQLAIQDVLFTQFITQ